MRVEEAGPVEEMGHCVVKVEFPWEGGWRLSKVNPVPVLHFFLVDQVSLLKDTLVFQA